MDIDKSDESISDDQLVFDHYYKSEQFIADFKSGNTDNELVKLCIDQGWVYKDDLMISPTKYQTCFYYPEKIYLKTILLNMYSLTIDTPRNILLSHNADYDVLNDARFVMIDLPERFSTSCFIEDIIVPVSSFIYDVSASGNNPHLSKYAIYDDFYPVCMGDLSQEHIYNLWRVQDMFRVSSGGGLRGLPHDIRSWLNILIENITNSLKYPEGEYDISIINLRDNIIDMIKNQDEMPVFYV